MDDLFAANWSELLKSPRFWVQHYSLLVTVEDDDWPEDEDEDRPTALSIFGTWAHPADEGQLHNWRRAMLQTDRDTLAAAGSIDSAIALALGREAPAPNLSARRAALRKRFEDASGPLPENKRLECRLRGASRLVFEYAPGSTNLFLRDDDERPTLLLGHQSGHQAVPALRLEEVRTVVAALDGDLRPEAMALLLFPFTWPEPEPDDQIRSFVRETCRRSEVVADPDELANVLLDASSLPECTPPVPSSDSTRFGWWEEDGVWRNNSPYSPRNPSSFFAEAFEDNDGFRRVGDWLSSLSADVA